MDPELSFLQFFSDDGYRLVALVLTLLIISGSYLIRYRMKLKARDIINQREIDLDKAKFMAILDKEEQNLEGKELDLDD